MYIPLHGGKVLHSIGTPWNCLVGALPSFTLRDITPLARRQGSPLRTIRSTVARRVFNDQAGMRGGGGCTQFVDGRSRMSINPRIPTIPGRSTSGFHQPGRHCLRQARSAVRCSASRMKGELHPSKNRSKDGLRHLVPTFLLMDDSANELPWFLVWPLQRQQWAYFLLYFEVCNCLVGALPSFTLRDAIRYDLTR